MQSFWDLEKCLKVVLIVRGKLQADICFPGSEEQICHSQIYQKLQGFRIFLQTEGNLLPVPFFSGWPILTEYNSGNSLPDCPFGKLPEVLIGSMRSFRRWLGWFHQSHASGMYYISFVVFDLWFWDWRKRVPPVLSVFILLFLFCIGSVWFDTYETYYPINKIFSVIFH